jgi:hypothetical protein
MKFLPLSLITDIHAVFENLCLKKLKTMRNIQNNSRLFLKTDYHSKLIIY